MVNYFISVSYVIGNFSFSNNDLETYKLTKNTTTVKHTEVCTFYLLTITLSL